MSDSNVPFENGIAKHSQLRHEKPLPAKSINDFANIY
jgi:hypothetical protein